MFTANLLPGHSFQKISVYKRGEARISATGRPQKDSLVETDITFLGALINASQNEKEQWKQNGHPISHKIIEFSAQVKAKPEEYLMTEDGRQFCIQGTENPGNMNLTIIYYVEERLDVKKKTRSKSDLEAN